MKSKDLGNLCIWEIYVFGSSWGGVWPLNHAKIFIFGRLYIKNNLLSNKWFKEID